MSRKVKLIQLAYHRNGIGGVGFYVAVVNENWDGDKGKMLIVRFPPNQRKHYGDMCAVFDIDKLQGDNPVGWDYNSWRGDRYVKLMDEFIIQQNGDMGREFLGTEVSND